MKSNNKKYEDELKELSLFHSQRSNDEVENKNTAVFTYATRIMSVTYLLNYCLYSLSHSV